MISYQIHDKNMMRTYEDDSTTKSEILCRAADIIELLDECANNKR